MAFLSKMKTWAKSSGTVNWYIGIAGVATLYVIATVFSPYSIKPTGATVTQVAGISLFAIFYLAAQLSERLTEVVSDILASGSVTSVDDSNERVEVAKSRIQAEINQNPTANVDDLVSEIVAFEGKSDIAKNRRAIVLWEFSSLIGVIFTSLTIGFFGLIGLTWVPHVSDSFMSGIIIGGGSKPLHDFITYIEKQKT